MSGPVQIVLIVAAVLYVLARRMAGEPAEGKRMLLLPLILMVIGLSSADEAVTTVAATVSLVVSGVVAVVFGVLRGVSVKLFERDGIVFVRYTWLTVAFWGLNLAVKAGTSLVLGGQTGNQGMLLTLGLGLLAEGVVVMAKAMRRDGGQVIWEKGKHGAHRTSPWLDDLRDRMSGRDPR